MSEDVLELQNEVEVLTKRIEVLEKRDNRRRSMSYIKITIKIILILAIIFGIWRGYEYVVHEVPNVIEEKIKDSIPFLKK